MSIVNLKIIFVKKPKQTRERPTQGGGGPFIITEMAVGLSVGEGAAVHRLGSVV